MLDIEVHGVRRWGAEGGEEPTIEQLDRRHVAAVVVNDKNRSVPAADCAGSRTENEEETRAAVNARSVPRSPPRDEEIFYQIHGEFSRYPWALAETV